MNLLLIIMNSYVIVSCMDKYDFVYKRISDFEHSLTFFINIFSPGRNSLFILIENFVYELLYF